jgi:hypothetical protein
VPPLSRPAITSSAPCHMIRVIDPKTSAMTIAVISARTRMRLREVWNAVSTAPEKRAASRPSCPNAWTIFIADSVSFTIAPTSAMRSWVERESLRRRRPRMMIGPMTKGMPSSSIAVSLGASVKR